MYSQIYNIGIQLMRLGIKIISFFNTKAKQRHKGENHWKSLVENNEKLAWFHCASLGEFEQGRPVLEAFKKEYPSYKILLTFFSPSGYEVRKNYSLADFVTYLPLDSKNNAREFVAHFQPSIAFFVKYEFWRNFALELKTQKIPLISFSTIFRPEQIYFKKWAAFPREALAAFDHFFVQNSESAMLLSNIAIDKITIAGDTRYDRVHNSRESVINIPIVADFTKNSETIVVGSAWQEDIDVLIPLINDPGLADKKWIIAPHEIDLNKIAFWSSQIKGSSQSFSEYNYGVDSQVLFIDNVGMLSAIYQYGYVAYIGGAFGKGLHNILEAAVFGIPVFFGNQNFRKFQEANELIELGSAKAINDSQSLKNEFLSLENSAVRLLIQDKNAKFIEHHLGATQKIIQHCKQVLKS